MCQEKYENNRFCEQWVCEYILAYNAYSLGERRKEDVYSQPDFFECSLIKLVLLKNLNWKIKGFIKQ